LAAEVSNILKQKGEAHGVYWKGGRGGTYSGKRERTGLANSFVEDYWDHRARKEQFPPRNEKTSIKGPSGGGI